MRTVAMAAALVVLLAVGAAHGGESHYWIGAAGVPSPLSQSYVEVTSVRVTITFAPRGCATDEVLVRAEFELDCERNTELQDVEVGFPVAYPYLYPMPLDSEYPTPPTAYVKLDGCPVPARFMFLCELAEPIVEEWLTEIDRLLEREPALREAVKAARVSGDEAALAGWLRGNLPEERFSTLRASYIAEGLLAGPGCPSDYWYDYRVEAALLWLDPDREGVNPYWELLEKWGHEVLLLDPRTEHLRDARDLEPEPGLGAFVFPVRLDPGKTHTLVVQHRQRLGGTVHLGPPPFKGLRYNLTNARRWGRPERVSIEVRIPATWSKAAIRPAPSSTAREGGFRVYRMRMARPVEELYISAVPAG